MRSISARDTLKALPHYKNEFDIIDPKNDAEVYAVLEAIGMDTRKGVGYDVALHRDMGNTVAVGYMLSSEYSTDSKYKDFLDTTDRIVVAGMLDPSLAREMEEIRGRKYNYRNEEETEVKLRKPNDPRYYTEEQLIEMGYTGGEEEDEYDGTVSDNYDVVSQQIETMKALLKIARGE